MSVVKMLVPSREYLVQYHVKLTKLINALAFSM
jgi:hypothetical protein